MYNPYHQMNPIHGIISRFVKIPAMLIMGYIGFVAFDSGLDFNKMITDPSSIEWSDVGKSLFKVADRVTQDIEYVATGPGKEAIQGFLQEATSGSSELSNRISETTQSLKNIQQLASNQ